MGKRRIGTALVAIMLLGVFGLTACTESLADYKAKGKAKIDAHVATKIQGDYATDKWATLLEAAIAGKQAVEDAMTKPQVDTAIKTAGDIVDAVRKEVCQLKQGFYSTDDRMVGVDLHGENEFALQIMIMSHLPIGDYNVDKGKLILHYTPDYDLVFDIGNDELTYLGLDKNGHIAEEWVIPIGTILRYIENV